MFKKGLGSNANYNLDSASSCIHVRDGVEDRSDEEPNGSVVSS